MKNIKTLLALAARLTIVALLFQPSVSLAQIAKATQTINQAPSAQMADGSRNPAGKHGGSLRNLGDYTVETCVKEDGISVFTYDQNQKTLPGKLGQVTLQFKNGKKYRYNLHSAENGSLAAHIDFSKLEGKPAEMEFKLAGLSFKRLSFKDFATIPLNKTRLQAAAISRQKICPVTGQPLGSMGKPIAVKVEGNEVFVCCQGCINPLKSEPDKYLKRRAELVISESTEADSELIAKQSRCPVMDQPLGSMGNPVKVLVGDKPVYLCCKGCLRKMKATPDKYVAMVHSTSSGKTQVR